MFIGKRIKKAFIQLSEEVLAGKAISSTTQKIIFSKMPYLLQYPMAKFLTHMTLKDRAAHGIDLKKMYPNVKF